MVAELRESPAARNSLIAELQRLLEESRRAGKRQSAPFKGKRSDNPARPSRKRGKGHGRRGHRVGPANPDRVLDYRVCVPAPLVCPGCGEATSLQRVARSDAGATVSVLVSLRAEIDFYLLDAVADARNQGYTWGQIATRLATTVSAARHRYAAYAHYRSELPCSDLLD